MDDIDNDDAGLTFTALPSSTTPGTSGTLPSTLAASQALARRQLLRRGLVAGAAVSTTFATTGCATLLDLLSGLVKAPQLSMKDFKIEKTTLSSLQVSVTALIKNPNPFGFHLDGLDWLVGLAGGDVAKGKTPKGITLKARGAAETPLALDFNLAKTAEAILELLEKRTVPLKIDAVGHLRAQKYKFDVPGTYETRLPMPELPAFDIPSFKMVGLRGTNLQFEVAPAVKNSNDFNIDVDAFDFDVKLGGRSVLSNKLVKNVTLKSNKKQSVPFNFDVGLAEIGLTVASLAMTPRLDWEVLANMKSGILKLPFKESGRVNLT